jgi:transposase
MAVREQERAARARAAAVRERRVLDCLAGGMNPLQASRAAGVSKSAAYRLNRKIGGVCRPPDSSYSARYLDREERYEIARLREAGLSVRAVAARTGRSPSTVCRELARNSDPRTGHYMPERAHQLAWARQRRPKASRLSRNPALRAAVQGMLDRRYSPEQASGRLKAMHPDDPAMQVSHETIYQSIYVYPRGELKRELQACLRSGRALRRPRGRREARGQFSGPPRSKAAWCPATTRATWSCGPRRPTPRSAPSSSGPPATSPCSTCPTGTPPARSPTR